MTKKIELPTESDILWQGADSADHEQLVARAAELRKKAEDIKKRPQPPRTLSEEDPYAAALAEAEAAEAEAAAFATAADKRGIKVVMRALARKKWAALTKAHPVREGNAKDETLGGNIDTMPEAMVFDSLASPSLGDDERHEFLDSLSDGQHDRLAWLAFRANKERGIADPKAKRA